MELNRDDYCDECWAIVSSENQELNADNARLPEQSSKTDNDGKSETQEVKFENDGRTATVKIPDKDTGGRPKGTIVSFKTPDVKLDGDEDTSSGKSAPPSTVASKIVNDKSYVSLKGVADNELSTTKIKSRIVDDTPKGTVLGKQNEVPKTDFADDIKSQYSMKSKSNWSGKYSSKHSSALSEPVTILSSVSEFLYGARPRDSDLCVDCLIQEHRNSFGRNLLRNAYGYTEDNHECRIIPVKKNHQGRTMQVCADPDCPRFKFWKIIDSGGEGWKVDDSFEGCFPLPREIGGSSCFVSSSGLCSKEQLVELSKVGLTPRIMDEVRPDIEVSEWFCGRGDSTSRYGYKVSLLDSSQLMMHVYGECKTLLPPEAPRWRKVMYTFRDYEPGVRYVLFHHGGQETTGGDYSGRQGAEGEGGGHRGSKMAGASVRARLPRNSQLYDAW